MLLHFAQFEYFLEKLYEHDLLSEVDNNHHMRKLFPEEFSFLAKSLILVKMKCCELVMPLIVKVILRQNTGFKSHPKSKNWKSKGNQ